MANETVLGISDGIFWLATYGMDMEWLLEGWMKTRLGMLFLDVLAILVWEFKGQYTGNGVEPILSRIHNSFIMREPLVGLEPTTC